jgi:hypothetical protein
MKVEEFTYDGFMVHSPAITRLMPYTAEFKEWTLDPGIAVCTCSDGVERLIPSCCLVDKPELPVQVTSHTGFYFGKPSTS